VGQLSRDEMPATAGRSAWPRVRDVVDCTLTAGRAQGNGDGIHDYREHGIGWFPNIFSGSEGGRGANGDNAV